MVQMSNGDILMAMRNYNHSNEVGVIVNIDNAIKINFGNY